MKYLCLCYYNTRTFAGLDPSEAEGIGAACRPHDAALRATGRVIAQGSLSLPEDWCHFVPGEGGPRLREGPYLGGDNRAGAFFVVDAEDGEEARRVASRHAAANYGGHLGFAVEVRPCELYETHDPD